MSLRTAGPTANNTTAGMSLRAAEPTANHPGAGTSLRTAGPTANNPVLLFGAAPGRQARRFTTELSIS